MRWPIWRSVLRFALAASAVLTLGVLSGLSWLLASESGGQFLAAQLTAWSDGQLRLNGWQGRLIDEWRIEQLRLDLPELRIEVQGLRVAWQPLMLRQKALAIDVLAIDRLEIRAAPSSSAPQSPRDLGLPLALNIAQLQIGHLSYGGLVPGDKQAAPDFALRQICAQVQSLRGVHQVNGLALETPVGHLSGELKINARAPFALALKLKLLGVVENYRANLDLSAEGTLAETRVHIAARSAMQGNTALKGQASLVVQAFAPLPLREAKVSVQGLDPAVFYAQAPHAVLDIEADLVPRLAAAGRTAPKDWRISGPVKISNQAPKTIEEGLPLVSAAAQLDWAAGQLRFKDLAVVLPGKGLVSGSLGWTQEAGKKLGRAEAALKLQDIDPAQLTHRARAMRISGGLEANGDEARQGFTLNLHANKMQLAVRGEQRAGTLSVEKASLQAFDAQAELSGSIALAGSRAFAVKGTLQRLDPHVFLQDVPEGSLNASFSADGALQPTAHGRFSLSLAPSRFAGYPLEGRASASVTPGRLQDADIDLVALGNSLRLQGAIGAAEDKLLLDLDAPHLERFGHDLAGSLKATASVQGSFDQPTGEFKLLGRQLRAPAGWRVANAEVSGRLQAGENGVVALKAVVRELSQAGADGSQLWLHDLNLELAGTRSEHQLKLQASLPAETKVEASAAGGLKGNDWRGRLLGLAIDGPLRLVLEKPAALELGADRIALGEARLLSQIAEHGRIELLQTEWTPEHLLARGRLSGVKLGLSLDEYQRTVFGGRSLQLGAEWDVALAETPRGLVHIFREGGDFVLQGDAPVALGLENLDINIAIEQNRLAVSALANGSRIGAFNAVATLALKGQGGNTRIDMAAPLVGVVNADMPSIRWLGPLVDQNLGTAGSLRGRFNITGTPEKPVGAGFLKGEELGLALNEQGLRLDRGKLQLNFDANRVHLETLDFHSDNRMAAPDGRLPKQLADGAVRGSGEITLSSGKGNFLVALDHVAAMQQPGQWLMLSGVAQVVSGWDQLDITARFKSDAGFIGVARSGAPKLSEDVVIRGRQKPPQRLKLNADIAFDFGDDFILKAYGIDTWLDGKLQIKLAQGSVPRATGSIRARDGVFNAYGQRLEIERGAVNFHGPLDDPALNIVALRKGLEVEAGVEVTGSAQRPKVRLVSEPSVPEQEKLAWILFGRPSEGSAADIGVLLSAAGANMGGDGEGLGARIASGFGLDNVGIASSSNGHRRGLQSSVANNATSGNATPSATNSSGSSAGETMSNQVLSLGKRLSSRAYLSFEQNFLGTESVVKLSYALTRFLSVIARGGTENALDLNYSVSFR